MNAPRSRFVSGLAALVLITAGVGAVPAAKSEPSAESYYMVIFGAEDDVGNPLTSHCFATFIKRIGGSAAAAEPRLELKHINWFTPRGHLTGVPHGVLIDGKIGEPEPGENRDTRSAFREACRHKLKVFKYGPFEIEKELYERACRHIDLLEGRLPHKKVLYKQIDLGLREQAEIVALNCIHAVSDIDRDHGPLHTGTSCGRLAAGHVVKHLKRWIKDPKTVHTPVWEWTWKQLWRDAEAPQLAIVDCALSADETAGSPMPARPEQPPTAPERRKEG